MELEEMKSLWEEMSSKIEKQSKITDSLILKMTNQNYRRKVNKLMVYEVIGALVCLLGLLFMAVNFYKLDTWYLQVCGLVSALILILLPVFSIKALCRMSRINISENNYQQTLKAYSKGKVQFLMVQKASFYAGAILLVSLLPVMGKLIAGHDFFKVSNIWLVYAISFPFFYYYAVWVSNNYTKSVLEAENMLKELAEVA
ncbi:hypothetical protein [Pedobacter gandavensis]|uniref:DUF3278 domain-containing protein n=1 Tax=Pedobacter gandavensis TaxID=2679963 RepID=A0ABR6ESB1_9SPHI|nr:hypothetical protein [Pedobacter gandavensis]MBB2148143.1 hypothetical protein [Pedobacter gandavensis]